MTLKSLNRRTVRNVSLILACGALAVGCAGTAVKPGSDKMAATSQKIEHQLVKKETTVKPDTAEATVALNVEPAEKFPLVDISDSKVTTKPEQMSFKFGFDKTKLGAKDIETLKLHAQYLIENPDMVMQINGHTDHNGPREYNEYLSKKRAEAVARVLIEEGVSQSQLIINALADTQPLANAKSSRENRRVEIEYDSLNLVSQE
jgi:peptidoglycan-associated lipoprotein